MSLIVGVAVYLCRTPYIYINSVLLIDHLGFFFVHYYPKSMVPGSFTLHTFLSVKVKNYIIEVSLSCLPSFATIIIETR